MHRVYRKDKETGTLADLDGDTAAQEINIEAIQLKTDGKES